MSTSEIVSAAETFVEDRRGTRPRADVDHALRVADLLRELGCGDVVIAAGILHAGDVDAGATAQELRGTFGDRVAELVGRLTEAPGFGMSASATARCATLSARAGAPRC